MKRIYTPLMLGFIGVLLSFLALTGESNRYLLPAFRPWLGVCGGFLLLIALWALARPAAHDHAMERSSWLMVLPVALLVFSAPASLGAVMVDQNAPAPASPESAASADGVPTDEDPGQILTGDPNVKLTGAGPNGSHLPAPDLPTGRAKKAVVQYPDLPAGEAPLEPIDDLVDRYHFGDPNQIRGRVVTLEGFISKAHKDDLRSGAGPAWRISRFKIFCCAADAQPFSVVIPGKAPGEVNQWVRAVVEIVPGDGPWPTAKLRSVELIPEPATPYM
ncbi:hypothetical protein BSR29_02530 [Boudabousia liubingyangii]|uniref:DUF1980 domain-containing protein n=1 Tax=Boudabousia liubingyangii TaxID=1921764 RepID=A0A1Q5PQM5_9ACTO|nr:hypothetical protein [Boudabousia liubingyangii]OKL46090.1 hypothetical protein BSR28_08510 [Boudabousia liubingyangii]OKL49836.1 hypothetical protein BSR29_02530 [Boudabousia liubingyangii]